MGREKTRQRLAIRKAFAPKKKVIPTHKQHRFESFSHRVSRLKIDPVRRERGRQDERDLEGLESNFRLALEKWRDLNLSEDFTTFARKVDPLCDNLPQVLHHQDKILELLLENIERSTAISAEPFLDLVAHLAQDLQGQFERHFEGTVRTLTVVAARHQDVEVVEWSFNCLTWLFKYLERILATEICPLYDLLSPYLGKTRQKPHVSRFTAESLSFLVKRVGKKQDATATFVKHALHDLVETARDNDTELYEHSLIALFVEAVKSTKDSLHSTGLTIFATLLSEVLQLQESENIAESALRIIRGVLIQLIHHTSAENILPILTNILQQTGSGKSCDKPKRAVAGSQLLLLFASIKNGHRVADWPAVFDYLRSQITALNVREPAQHKDVAIEVLSALAVAHQRCPLDTALANLSTFDILCSTQWQDFFPGFCNLYAEYGIDRFRSFLLPRLQKFMTTYWDRQTMPLSVLVPKLVQSGAVLPKALKMTTGCEENICESFAILLDSDSHHAADCNSILRLVDSVSVSPGTKAHLVSCLRQKMSDELEGQITPMQSFVLGHGFQFISNNFGGKEQDGYFLELLPLLASAASKYLDFPAFIKALAGFFKQFADKLIDNSSPELTQLRDALFDCLSSRSHEIRLAALETLCLLIPSEREEWRAEMASAIEIESTEPSLETARYISMKIKNLGMHYKSYADCALLAQAIPRWLFGLLHVKYAQVWEDSCAALKDISEVNGGEELICNLVFQWLGESPLREDVSVSQTHQEQTLPDEYFSSLRAGAMTPLTFANRIDEIVLKQFEGEHQRVPMLTPMNRTQALKVLAAMPHLAEKKSRQLVPILLSWSHDQGIDEAEGLPDPNESSTLKNSHDEYLRWPRRDQKSLLGIFAAFVNPKVLYKTDEVYATLSSLIAHGDAEVQKSALQALLAWKDKTLRKYSEELYKFLDDARLREQLTNFLDGSAETALSAEDRSTVMPIVLRLVYGRIIARSRAERGSNRKAVFIILAKFDETEINTFLDVMIGEPKNDRITANKLPIKRRMGLMNMIKDLLETWKTTAAPYVHRLVPQVYQCLVDIEADGTSTALTKALRQSAMQCLNLCFEAGDLFDWKPYMPSLFQRAIRPRLNKFAEENAQGVSSLMNLFGVWAKSARLAHNLYDYENSLLLKVIDCLSVPYAKEQVKRFIINDVLQPLLSHSEDDSTVGQVAKQISGHLSEQTAVLLSQKPSKESTEDAISMLTVLTPYSTTCSSLLLSTSARLIQQPSRNVPHRSKRELLALLSHFFSSMQDDATTRSEVFGAVCGSFAYFGDAESRILLVKLAQQFAAQDTELWEVISLLDDINSFDASKLGLPDFDRRSRAFSAINESRWTEFSAKQWRLLLGNLMFFIKDVDELAIRASASHALRRFVQASVSKTEDEKSSMMSMTHGLLSSIEVGLKEQPELVQIEYLSVLAEIARLPEVHNPIYDLRSLLMGGDEEASYFTNILHVQHHRRVRAMNRLASTAAEGAFSGKNLYHLIFPLLESFVIKSGDGILAAEASKTIGSVVEWLDWQQCKVLIKRYIGFVKSKEDMQETVLKLLDFVTNGFCRSAASKAEPTALSTDQPDEDEVMDETPEKALTTLSRTMPNIEKLSQYILDEVLPPLSVFLREKDESFVSRRISVALVAANFVQLLPGKEFQIRFPPLLTDVCNILRSKNQGSRDATRRALSSICALVGPSAVGFIIRELRSALQRGFYLHVLAFTVHSVLETTVPNIQPGDLDYCAADIMDVVVEDVFGNTGKEKDFKEYLADKQTKKEVKGKKSFDTLQILASVTSLEHLIQIVRPIQALLGGHLSSKEVRYIDELLRRFELGILQNSSLKSRDILRFCYEVIQKAHDTISVTGKKSRPSSGGLVESAYLVRAPKKALETTLHASEGSGKIIRCALGIVRDMLKKYKELLTPGNVSGLLPVIGESLLNPNEEVKLAAIRLFSGTLNVPLPRIDEDAPVYIAEAAKIVEDGQHNGTELEQASLKLISAVLRERKSAPVKVKARTISLLLKRLKGDLQIISQQGAAFNLLRSIISRQIIVPELYEIMDGDDGVAAILVRDHDRTTRDLARGVYFQFLMECPQGKVRWAKQLAFLKGNLEFEYPEGRKSIMDTLHLLLGKVGDDVVNDAVKAMFWPLVGVMINDTDSDCREMAGGLIKKIFERCDKQWESSFLDLCRKLLESGNPVQKRTALQCWTLYLDANGNNADDTLLVLESIKHIIKPDEFDVEHWQLVYWALHTFAAIAKLKHNDAFAKSSRQIWIDVWRLLNFPHLWVKQEAAGLVDILLQSIIASDKGFEQFPLAAQGKVTLNIKDACDLTTRHLRLLKDGVTQQLASQVIRNLAFFGKVFASSGVAWHNQEDLDALAVKDVDNIDDEFQGFSDGEEENGEEMNEISEETDGQSALHHLLSQLAAILRREPGKMITPGPRHADSLIPKTAALQLLKALCSTLSEPELIQFADVILSPLVHLSSPDLSITAHSTADYKTSHEELVNNATELQDNLRTKLGTTVFVQSLQRIQNAQRVRREERRAKRKIEMIARPEIAARKKAKRMERNKEQRREKNVMQRGKRRGW